MLLSFWLLFWGPVSVFSTYMYYSFIHFVCIFYVLEWSMQLIKWNINQNGIEPFVCLEPIFEWEMVHRAPTGEKGETDKEIASAIKTGDYCRLSWLVLLQCIASWSAFYDSRFFFRIDFWTFRQIATKFFGQSRIPVTEYESQKQKENGREQTNKMDRKTNKTSKVYKTIFEFRRFEALS